MFSSKNRLLLEYPMDNCAGFCTLWIKTASYDCNKCFFSFGGIVIGILVKELLDFVVNDFDVSMLNCLQQVIEMLLFPMK